MVERRFIIGYHTRKNLVLFARRKAVCDNVTLRAFLTVTEARVEFATKTYTFRITASVPSHFTHLNYCRVLF